MQKSRIKAWLIILIIILFNNNNNKVSKAESYANTP